MQRVLIADATGGLEEARQALETGSFTVTGADDVEAALLLAGDVDIIVAARDWAVQLIERLGKDRPRIISVGEALEGADVVVDEPPDPGRLLEAAMELMASGPRTSSQPAAAVPLVTSDDDISETFDPASILDEAEDDLDDLLGGLTPVDTREGGDGLPLDESTPTPEPVAVPLHAPVESDSTAKQPGVARPNADPDDAITGVQPRPTPDDEPSDGVGDGVGDELDEDTAPDIWAVDMAGTDSKNESVQKPDAPQPETANPDSSALPAAAQQRSGGDDSPTRIMTIPELPPGGGSDEEDVAVRLAEAEYAPAPAVANVADDDLVALFSGLELPAIQVEVHDPPTRQTSLTGPTVISKRPPELDEDRPTRGSKAEDLDPAALGEAAERIERAVLRYAGYAPLQSIPEVFGRLVTEAETGTLLLRQGEVVKSIAFILGAPVFATSSQRTDRLGEVLYRAAMLSRDQLDSALKIVSGSGQSLGKVLLGQGVLSPHDLFGALRRQVMEIIFSIFAWRRGEFSFLAGEPSTDDRFPLAMSPAGVVMEGVRRNWTLPEILERFGGQDRIPIPSATRYFAPEDLDLTDTEAKVLGVIDGKRTIRKLLGQFGGNEENTARVMFALLCLGGIRVDDESGASADVAATPAPEKKPERPRPAPQSSGDNGRKVPSKDLEASSDPPEVAELKRRIRAKHKQVQTESYFAILGVPDDGPEVDIKAAYDRMEKAFRPARYGAPEFADVRKLIEEIHKAVTEAYEVLADPEMRENYRRGLAR